MVSRQRTILRVGILVSIAALASAVASGLAWSGVLEPLELKGFDWLVSSTPPAPLPPEIALVDFDDDAMAAWGFPIPRSRVAEVLARIDAGGPDLVGLDFLLSEPRGPEEDALMAQTLARAGNVIIARNFESKDLLGAEPLPDFTDAALDTAFVNVPVDEDGMIRRTFLAVRTAEAAGLSLPAALAANRLGEPLRAGAVAHRLGELSLPLDGSPLGTALIGAWHVRPDPEVVSAAAVLAPGFDPGRFAGRIVLVGQSNSAAKDLYTTPAFLRQGGGLFPGAEIHADALSAILNGRLVSPVGPVGQATAVLAAAGAAAAGGLFLGSAAGAAAPVGVGLAVYSVADLLLARHVWLRFVSVELGMALAFTLALGYRVWDERRRRELVDQERKQVMALFARYVSPEVVERIWETRGTNVLTGHECEVTVLFSDIRGFTSLTEGRPSTEVLRWLNEYFTEMSAVIKRNDGFLNKFIGDGLMVVYGAPLSGGPENDACRAVETALEMHACVERLNAEPTPYRPQLRIGVGLHTGPVTAGNVGAEERMEYSVVGETVNVASRLETLTKEYKTGVLMSGSTHALVATRFHTRKLGDTTVRGLSGTTPVYTVTARREREESR